MCLPTFTTKMVGPALNLFQVKVLMICKLKLS